MEIKTNIINLKKDLPSHVKLVAVSKTLADKLVMEAYDAGHRLFGENRAQDLKHRFERLPGDIHWHFIGHLQTNKVKYIASKVEMIHSIDSLRLLQEINKEAEKHHRIIKCLLQFHIAEEETKFGFNLDEAMNLLSDPELSNLQNICISGVMGMATYTDDLKQIRKEFRQLRSYFDSLKLRFFAEEKCFCELSMGMSGDYHIAIEEGSTLVRIGSSIFGERNYIY
jgi:pyridoxal phosphate enzyme (YggS family)